MKTILIIEDDRALSGGLCLALKDAQLRILPCHDLQSARDALAKNAVDLVLLDVNLPDGSGLELLREIKSSGSIPVILLTANDTEMDVVTGLEYGADDYITKPFSLAILRARINARMRQNIQKIVIDSYAFDFESMEFSLDGRLIELSKTEQKLLRILTENRGVTLSRDTLFDRVWGTEFVDENTLSVTVKRLRDKLNAAEYIKTVYGIGYQWVAK